MPQALPLPEKITAAQKAVKARLLFMQFGGGFLQTAPNGQGSVFDNYSVTWHNLSKADRDTVVAAIRATNGSDYFTYTGPGEATSKRFVIPPESEAVLYEETPSAGMYTISMNLLHIPG